MFTGIIQEVGNFKRKVKENNKYKLEIEVNKFLEDVSKGDSIAVNGVCLTVVDLNSNSFTVDVMPETVKSTNLDQLTKNSKVNLEKSLQPNSFMGGHIVSGHVDGVGILKSVKDEKNAKIFTFKITENISKYLVDKGSVALNGISLTIMDYSKENLIVSIIPETIKSTNLKYLNIGDEVNIETDIIGKYVNKFLNENKENNKKAVNKNMLKENGFI
ncbi:MAG TPA: riboflavin synthase [Halanaerobiales bacterium]|nr:riboflavin synthase [Halanaerobiales bacterium]